MQIFWVSSSVGQIKSITITYQKLIVLLMGLVLFFLSLGVALQFFGFRMAIEYDPSLARKLGNLHSAVELENLNALYQLRLQELNQQIQANHAKIDQLTELNKKLSELATPAPLRKHHNPMSQGGGINLHIPSFNFQGHTHSTLDLFRQHSKDIQALNQFTQSSIQHTQQVIAWLQSIPVKAPLRGEMVLASGFGKRLDPVNSLHSFHPGVDFTCASGTPFYATANGRVIDVNHNSEYGNQLLIQHAEGITTRYAHAQSIAVKPGMFIHQGDYLGTTGNTGKSTGPHLHYETIRNGENRSLAMVIDQISTFFPDR